MNEIKNDQIAMFDGGRRVALTVYSRTTNPKPIDAGQPEWNEVVETLSKHDVREDKEGRCISFHQLMPGATRANANVELVSAYVIDSDDGAGLDEIKKPLTGLEYVIYSTHSHTPDKPKYRVVFPLSAPVGHADWDYFRGAADAELAGGHNDGSTKDASRLYYTPSCPESRAEHAYFEHVRGEAIDSAAMIAKGRAQSARSLPGLPQIKPRKYAASVARNADVLGVSGPVDLERARSALMAIPSDGGRYEWRGSVWGFDAATNGEDQNFLRGWNAQSADKYPNYREALEKLLRSDTKREGGVAAGTLFMLAKQHGWTDPAHSKRIAASPDETTRLGNVMETLNDAGNADRIVKAANGNLQYCRDLLKWLVWTDGHWHWDIKGDVVQFATAVMRGIYTEARDEARNDDAKRLAQHAGNSCSLRGLTAGVELAKSMPGVSVGASELDADPMVIGVVNGVVDLKTGEFRQALREGLITRLMNVEWIAGATCPHWEATLHSIFNDNRDVVDFVQRAMGYTLTGRTTEQCFFFLYGTGANGKSTVLNVLREILGGYGIQTSPEVLMAKTAANASGPTPEIARLAGPRFVAANETEEGQRFAESMVKQLTGGDAVTARVLHGAPFDFVPVFKLWLAGNHRPVIRGDDHGIWRRMVMIGFDRKFSGEEQNKHLPDMLRKEYPGILNWLIAGCLAWQKHGLDRPAEITRQVDAYRSDMDLMGNWIDETCIVEATAVIKAGAAYTSYKNWSFQNGHRFISNQKFAQKLKDRGFDKGHGKAGTHYFGLGFRQGQF
ncbi:DNA primase family protein [Actimicrobium antarcticum]